jgi:two-component system, cell cycle sensor histidine kinase and response regulator CckA
MAKLNVNTNNDAIEDIVQVLKASNRAADLVQHILTFSRKSDHHLEPLALHLIIKEALKMMRASLPTTIEIQETIDSKCGEIKADATNIHPIIVNPCTNNLHAIENEKGVLSVSLYQKEITGEAEIAARPFIVIEINDTGQNCQRGAGLKIDRWL